MLTSHAHQRRCVGGAALLPLLLLVLLSLCCCALPSDAVASWDPASLPHPNVGWPSWLVRLHLPRGSPALYVGTEVTAQLSIAAFYGQLNLSMPTGGPCQFIPAVVQFTEPGALTQPIRIMPTALADPTNFPAGGAYALTITPAEGADTYGIGAISWNLEIWPAHNPAGVGGTGCPAGTSSDGFLRLSSSTTGSLGAGTYANTGVSAISFSAAPAASWSVWTRRAILNSNLFHAQAFFSVGDAVYQRFAVGFLEAGSEHVCMDSGNDQICSAASYNELNQWVHWSGQRAGMTGTLWRNGVQVMQQTYSNAQINILGTLTIGSLSTVGSPLHIDSYFMQGGSLDELRFWRRGLSGTEVSEGYSSGRWNDEQLVLYYPFTPPTTAWTATDYTGHGRTVVWSVLSDIEYVSVTSSGANEQVCTEATLVPGFLPSVLVQSQSVTLDLTPSQRVREQGLSFDLLAYNVSPLPLNASPRPLHEYPIPSASPWWVSNNALTIGADPVTASVSTTMNSPDPGAGSLTPWQVMFRVIIRGSDALHWTNPEPILVSYSQTNTVPGDTCLAADDGHIASRNNRTFSVNPAAQLLQTANLRAVGFDLSDADFALSIWVRLTCQGLPGCTGTGASHAALSVGGAPSAPSANFVSLGVMDSAGTSVAAFAMASHSLLTTGSLTPSTWYCLTASYRSMNRWGAGGAMAVLWVNGGSRAQNTPSTTTPLGAFITLGAQFTTAAAFGFMGALDEARVFSRALSDFEALTLYKHNQASSVGLEAYYPMSVNESASVLLDRSGRMGGGRSIVFPTGPDAQWLREHAHPLCAQTAVGCPRGFSDDGHLVLDGDSSRFPMRSATGSGGGVRMADLSGVPFDYSVSFWILRTATSPANVQYIWHLGDLVNPCTGGVCVNTMLHMGYRNGADADRLFADYFDNEVPGGPREAQTGVWTQYVLTTETAARHPGAGKRRVYRNGVLLMEDTAALVDLIVPGSGLMSLYLGGHGSPSYGGSDQLLLFSRVDEFMLFHRALDGAEVWTSFLSKHVANTTALQLYLPFSETTLSGIVNSVGAAALTLSTRVSSTAFVVEYSNPICLAATLVYAEITTSGGLPLSDPRIQGKIQPLGLVTLGVSLSRAHAYDPQMSVQCAVTDISGYVYQTFAGSLFKLQSGFSSSPQVLPFSWTAPGWSTVLYFGCHWTSLPMYRPPPRQPFTVAVRPKIPVRLVIDHYDPGWESNIVVAPDQSLTGSVSIDSFLADPGITVYGNAFGVSVPTFSDVSLVSPEYFGPHDTIGTVASLYNSLALSTEYVQTGVAVYTVTVARPGSCSQTEDGHLTFSAPPGTTRASGVPRFLVEPSRPLAHSAFTISLWVRNDGDPNRFHCALELGNDGSAASGSIALCFWYSPFAWATDVSAGPVTDILGLPAGSFDDRAWTVWTLTVDPAELGSTWRGYNGFTEASMFWPYNFTGSNLLSLGCGRGGEFAWLGAIDDVRVWDRRLTHTEIFRSFQPNVYPASGLLFHASFGEQRGVTVRDSVSGLSSNFTEDTAMASWERAAPRCPKVSTLGPPAVPLDCGNGRQDDGAVPFGTFGPFVTPVQNCLRYLNVEPVAGTDPLPFSVDGQSFTIGLYLRRFTLSDADPQWIMSWGDDDAPSKMLVVSFSPTEQREFTDPFTFISVSAPSGGNRLNITWGDGTALLSQANASINTATDTWFQLVITYQNGASKRRSAYINGELLMSDVPLTDFSPWNGTEKHGAITVGSKLFDGSHCDKANFNGFIDEFRIYTGHAFDAQTIAQWYFGVAPTAPTAPPHGSAYPPAIEPTSDASNATLAISYGMRLSFFGDSMVQDDSTNGRHATFSFVDSPTYSGPPDHFLCLPNYPILQRPLRVVIGQPIRVAVRPSQASLIDDQFISVRAVYNNTDVLAALPAGVASGSFAAFPNALADGSSLSSYTLAPDVQFDMGTQLDVKGNVAWVLLPPSWSPRTVAVSAQFATGLGDWVHQTNALHPAWQHVEVRYDLTELRLDCGNGPSGSPGSDIVLLPALNAPMPSSPNTFVYRSNYTLLLFDPSFVSCTLSIVSANPADTFDLRFTQLVGAVPVDRTVSGNSPSSSFAAPEGGGEFSLSIQSTLPDREGARSFRVVRSGDVTALDLLVSSNATSVGSLMTSLATSPALSPLDLSSLVRTYTATTSFVQRFFFPTLVFNTSASIKVEWLNASDSTYIDLLLPTLLTAQVPVLAAWELSVGLNRFRISSSIDSIPFLVSIQRRHDVYNFTLLRAESMLWGSVPVVEPANLGLRIPAFAGAWDGFLTISPDPVAFLSASSFDPDAAREQMYGIRNLPFAVSRLTFVVDFSSDNVTLVCGSRVVPLVSGVPFVFQAAVGYNILQFTSAVDPQVITFAFYRKPPILTALTWWTGATQHALNRTYVAGTSDYEVVSPVSESTIQAHWTSNLMDTIAVMVINSTVGVVSGPLTFSNYGPNSYITPALALQVGLNVVVFQTKLDGFYRLFVTRVSNSSSSSTGMADSSSASDMSSSSAMDSSSSAMESSSSMESSSAVESSSGVASSSSGPDFVLPEEPPVILVVSPGFDPCVSSSPCDNRGVCSSYQTGAASANTVFKAMRCACLDRTYGPTCSFALLGCLGQGSAMCTSSFAGGTPFRLVGRGLGFVRFMEVHGERITVDSLRSLNRSEASGDAALTRMFTEAANTHALADATELDVISFRAPSLVPWLNRTRGGYSTQAMDHDRTLLSFDSVESLSAGRPSFSSSLRSSHSAHSAVSFARAVNPDSTYHPLGVHLEFADALAGPHVRIAQTLNFTTMLYFTTNYCVNESQWQPDGLGGCLGCPEGAHCPGGGRAWPLAGYWSTNELAAPMACRVPSACPGFAGVGAAPGAQANTAVCSAAYTGTACTECAESFYSLSGRCYACGGSPADQEAQLVAVSFAALVLMGLVSLGVAFLRPALLTSLVAFVIVLQNVVQVGVIGSRDLPVGSQQASALFAFLSLVNFNIEIARPGCGSLPPLNYVSVFWITVGMIAVTGLMFVLACLARLRLRLSRERADLLVLRKQQRVESRWTAAENRLHARSDLLARRRMTDYQKQTRITFVLPPWTDFRLRLTMAMLVLGTLFYLKLTTMQMQAFDCTLAPEPAAVEAGDPNPALTLLLTSDLQTPCYARSHLATAVLILLLFVFYTFGFPLLCFILLVRAFADEQSTGVSGWLVHHWPRVFLRTYVKPAKRNKFSSSNSDLSAGEGAPSPAGRQLSSFHLRVGSDLTSTVAHNDRHIADVVRRTMWNPRAVMTAVRRQQQIDEREGSTAPPRQQSMDFAAEGMQPATPSGHTRNGSARAEGAPHYKYHHSDSSDAESSPMPSPMATAVRGRRLEPVTPSRADHESALPLSPSQVYGGLQSSPSARVVGSAGSGGLGSLVLADGPEGSYSPRLSPLQAAAVHPPSMLPGTPMQAPAPAMPQMMLPAMEDSDAVAAPPAVATPDLCAENAVASSAPSSSPIPGLASSPVASELAASDAASSLPALDRPMDVAPAVSSSSSADSCEATSSDREAGQPESSPAHSSEGVTPRSRAASASAASRAPLPIPPPPPAQPPHKSAPPSYGVPSSFSFHVPSSSSHGPTAAARWAKVRKVVRKEDFRDSCYPCLQSMYCVCCCCCKPPDDPEDEDLEDAMLDTALLRSALRFVPLESDPRHDHHSEYLTFLKVSRFGHLFIGLKHEDFAHRMQLFFVNFWFAGVTAFESDTQRQLFLMGLSFAAQVLLINWHWPYLRRFDNLRVTLLTSLSLIHVTVLLGVQTRGSETGWFISLCVLFSLICLIVAGRRKLFRGLYSCLCPTRLRLLDDEEDKMQRASDAKTLALEGDDDLEDSGLARKPVMLLTLAPIAEDDALSRQSSVEMQRVHSADIEAREAADRAKAEKDAQDEAEAAAAAAVAAAAAAAALAATVVVHPDPSPPEPAARRRGLVVPATLPPPKPTAESLPAVVADDECDPVVEPPPSGLVSPPLLADRSKHGHKSFMTLALLNPREHDDSDDEGERESSKEPGAQSSEPASAVDEPTPQPVDEPVLPAPSALKARLPALPRMASANRVALSHARAKSIPMLPQPDSSASASSSSAAPSAEVDPLVAAHFAALQKRSVRKMGAVAAAVRFVSEQNQFEQQARARQMKKPTITPHGM